MRRAWIGLAVPLLAALHIGAGPCDAAPVCDDGFEPAGAVCVQRPTTSGLRIHEGDLRFNDVGALQDFCADANAVLGNVQVRVVDAEHLDALGCLRRVSGSLRLDDMAGLERLSLPALEHVGRGLFVQGNPRLSTLELPRLADVGGAVAVQYNPALAQVELPSLHTVGRFVAVYANGIRRVSFPVLERVGADDLRAEDVFYVRVNLFLKEISAPKLAWVAGVVKISSNDSMLRIHLPALEEVGSGIYVSFSQSFRELTLPTRDIGGFLYLQHSHLQRLSLPCLEDVVGDVAVNFNENLTQLDLPRIESVGGFVNIQTNPRLPEDQIEEILDLLDGNVGAPSQVGANGPPTGERSAAPPCGLDEATE